MIYSIYSYILYNTYIFLCFYIAYIYIFSIFYIIHLFLYIVYCDSGTIIFLCIPCHPEPFYFVGGRSFWWQGTPHTIVLIGISFVSSPTLVRQPALVRPSAITCPPNKTISGSIRKYMAPRWHQETIALRALKSNINTTFGKMPRIKS